MAENTLTQYNRLESLSPHHSINDGAVLSWCHLSCHGDTGRGDLAVQGDAADIGGYYKPDADKASSIMRPSTTFNSLLATL